MRITLLTIVLITLVILIGAQTHTIAQSGTDARQASAPALYTITPSGNYVFRNPANGHTSDSRANSAADNSTSLPVSIKRSAFNKRTDGSPIQAAPDGNSGFHLQITNSNNVYAQTGFYFMLNASDKYVFNEDAVQIDGPGPMVFLSSYTSDNVNVCLNTMSDYAESKRARLFVNGVGSGQYTLSMADFNEMDTASYSIYLIDHQQKDSVNLVHKTYPFNIEAGDTTSFGAYRFSIAIEHKPVEGYALSSFSGEKVSAGVQLNWTTVGAGNYTGYTLQKLNGNDSAGDSLYFVQSDNGTNNYSFTDEHPVMGNNVYRLKQNGINGAITYSATVTIGYSNAGAGGALSLYPNPAKSIMNAKLSSVSVPKDQAYIYNSMGGLVKREPVNQTIWTEDLSSYKTGLYFIQIKDSSGNIVAQSKFVKTE